MPEKTRAMRADRRGAHRARRRRCHPGGGPAGAEPEHWLNHMDVTRVARMPYEVQTAVFEGPFDLLLHLILREQVDLYEVSLSTIVDAFLSEVERLDVLDLEVATEFLLIAATLI